MPVSIGYRMWTTSPRALATLLGVMSVLPASLVCGCGPVSAPSAIVTVHNVGELELASNRSQVLLIAGGFLTNDDAWRLQRFDSLHELDLNGCKGFGDGGCKSVARLTTLRTLSMSSTAVTPHGVAELTPLKALRVLDLSRTDMSALTPETLLSFQSLEVLKLSHSRISGDVVLACGHMPDLAKLWLAGCDSLNDETARNLSLDNGFVLREIDVSHTAITLKGLQALCRIGTLENVIAHDIVLSEADVAILRAKHANVTLQTSLRPERE